MFCFFYFTSSVSFTGSYTEVKPDFDVTTLSRETLQALFTLAKVESRNEIEQELPEN